MVLISQLVYLAMLILIGSVVLLLRRKAEGSKSGYKLTLTLLGILLGLLTLGNDKLFAFDSAFLKAVDVLLLVTLLFEMSVRLNPENIRFTPATIGIFFIILFVNVLVLGTISTILLRINFLNAMIFAIIMSSIEYFMVDQLKEEGDLANPLLVFFAFSLLVFYTLPDDIFTNTVFFLKYILIGLAMGVIVGIIVFKSMKNRYLDSAHELGLVAVALATYILTEQISGSGLFAVMILGVFFGNSYVRKMSQVYGFSPFIFKSLEMLIFLIIGFTVPLMLSWQILWRSLVIFAVYLVIRFVVIYFVFENFSIENKLLLSLAPKGMLLGVMILVLGAFGTVEVSLLNSMLLVLILSLLFGVVLEYLENRKVLRLDKIYRALLSMRFGRKRDLPQKRRWHTYYK